jgi:hypothetical protein
MEQYQISVKDCVAFSDRRVLEQIDEKLAGMIND